MGGFWKGFLLAFLAPLGVTVMGGLILIGIERGGWLEAQVPILWPFLTWVRESIGPAAYPWVAGITIGMALGIIVYRFVTGVWEQYVRWRTRRLIALSRRMMVLVRRMQRHEAPTGQTANDMVKAVLPELLALEPELKALRLKLPETAPKYTHEAFIDTYATYLENLAPTIRAGHLRHARKIARDIVKASSEADKSD